MAIKTHLKDDKVMFTVTVNNVKIGVFESLDEAKQCELNHKNNTKQADINPIVARLDKQDAIISELQSKISKLELLAQNQSTSSSSASTSRLNTVVQNQSTSSTRNNTVDKNQSSSGYKAKSVADESDEW